jgi:hypothetical protein
MRAALLSSALVLLAAPAHSQRTGPFTVAETGQSFMQLQKAVDAIEQGSGTGTIRIAPGRYADCAVQEKGSIAFVAEQPGQSIFDKAICESKGTLVLRGQASHVEGLVFTHMEVPDGNGAGIRMEQGTLTVKNAMFIDGQSGILSANDLTGDITIDQSTFAGLGKDPTGNGAHGIYIGGKGGLRVLRSRFERGNGGHYLKSRVPRVEIVGNSFDDSRGSHTNYAIDLSWGAVGRIADNSFVQGPNKDNYSTMITVAPEGRENSSAGLVIENNRAWVAPGFDNETTFVGNWTREQVVVRNNTLHKQIEPYAQR